MSQGRNISRDPASSGTVSISDVPDDLPEGRGAVVYMLQDGYSYVKPGYDYQAEGDAHIGPSIGLVLDENLAIIIDPGFVEDRAELIAKVQALGVGADEVTDIVFSHHHPDHTVNAALFPNARIHDHWAVYQGDAWHAREADLFSVSPSVRLIRTPGHTTEDITTLVRSGADVYAFTHAWATREQPAVEPTAPDTSFLLASRRRILRSANIIVPGHAEPFRP